MSLLVRPSGPQPLEALDVADMMGGTGLIDNIQKQSNFSFSFLGLFSLYSQPKSLAEWPPMLICLFYMYM